MKIENILFDAAFKNDSNAIEDGIKNFGLDPNTPHPRGGQTPLQMASEADAIGAASSLLKAGADPNKRFTRISRVDGRIIIKEGTAIMSAKSREMIELLINAGADINAKDSKGWSALAFSVYSFNDVAVDALLNLGGDPNIEVETLSLRMNLRDLLNQKLRNLHETFSPEKTEELGLMLQKAERIASLLSLASGKDRTNFH